MGLDIFFIGLFQLEFNHVHDQIFIAKLNTENA